MTELEEKEVYPKCGNVGSFSRDMTSPRVCKCGHTWDALEKFRFSKLRQEIEKASLEIVKSRQYRGARESDYRAWLCDYVESNFVPKSDYEKLKAQLERAEEVIEHYKSYCVPQWVDVPGMNGMRGVQEIWLAREYFKEKESK